MAIYQGREFYEDQDARISPSWPERTLRGRIHYCRLIETKPQESTCRSGAGHTFGTHNGRSTTFFVTLTGITETEAAGTHEVCIIIRLSRSGRRQYF